MALTDNLVAYWRLDEASGSRVDATGRGNDLTDNNTVTQATGILGSAGQFTRANSEWLSRTDNSDLSTGDVDFTVQAWVYLDSKPASDYSYIFTKSSTTGPVVEFNCYYDTVADRFKFEIFDNPPSVSRVATANNLGSPSLGTWYHIVGWHDAVNNLVGIAVNAGTANATATSGTAPGDTAAPFELGRYGALASRYMNGRIDEVGYWKRVLTSAERTALYNSGSGLAYPFTSQAKGLPVIAHYHHQVWG